MSGGRSLGDQDRQSFELIQDSSDEAQKIWARIVKIFGSIEGTFTPTGAQVALLVEEVEVNDSTWTELTTEKARRNALNIQNRSFAEDEGHVNLYLRHSSSGTASMKVPVNGERQYAISNVAIFAKFRSGDGTHKITIEALA